MSTSASEVFLGEHKVGNLLRLPGEKINFSFDQAYLDNPNRPTLSLSYFDKSDELIQANQFSHVKAPPFFSNLLPEGHLRQYIASKADVKIARDFPLLNLLGGDLPGNVIIKPLNLNLPDSQKEETKNILSDGNLHFSLAGVQLKLSAILESTGGLTIRANGLDGEWILKLPSMQFPEVPENEYFMMKLASKLGLDVPEVRLVQIENISGLPEDLPYFSGKSALAIRRFDRTSSGRVHFEDFAQIYGVYPEKKYDGVSYNNLAETVYKAVGAEALHEFIRRLVFSVLVGNGDMHLKNWAVLYEAGSIPKLAPMYDQLSTVVYMPADQIALKLGKTKKFQDVAMHDFEVMVKRFNLPASILKTVQQFVERFHDNWPSERENLLLQPELLKVLERHIASIKL